MYNNEAYKNKILKCAKIILSTEGAKALNISRIVKECKISNSTFYRNFKSKEELLLKLKEQDNKKNEELLSIREKIISKAGEQFSKNTFNEINIETIAESVGINRSSIYRYFSNKEELLEASILNEMNNRKKYIQEIKDEEEDPIKFLEKYMDYFFNFANNKYTSLLYATMIYYSKQNEKIRASYDSLREYSIKLLIENFEDGKRKNIFKEDFDCNIYSQMFFSVMAGINIHSPKEFLKVSKKFWELLYREIKA